MTDMAMASIDGEGVTISGAELSSLGESLRGGILEPGDEGYDEARCIWNAMIDRRPAAIVQCAGSADVIAAVRFAAERGILISVRGGGHNVGGKAVCEGGLMIDLSSMRRVEVDAPAATARAQGGAVWGNFDAATQAHGLATPGGIVSSTGVGGLTLGGGIGWLVNKHGLACDNLIGAEVVTADGRTIRASDTENPDLMWGLRGGGGNFGVVTELEFRLHPVTDVMGGMILFPAEVGRDVLSFFRDFAPGTPDDLNLQVAFVTSPDGVPVVGFLVGYFGPESEGRTVLAPVRDLATPLVDTVTAVSYVQHQQLLDEAMAAGMRNYWKSSFLDRLDDDAIEVATRHTANMPSPHTVLWFEHFGTGFKRVAADATAFGHRDADFNLGIASAWPDAADDARNIEWTRETFAAMKPFAADAVYVNYLDLDDSERVRQAYGDNNYTRLLELKQKYDPDNFFRMNANIA